MAIFHFKMQMISRAHGRSATAAAAYRGGYAIEDERTGRTFDYSRRVGVMDDTILVPNRAPEWARNGEDLWNAVELAERRKDAQVARENVVALPHELSYEQNREMLHRFVQEAYVRRGMAAQVSIHGPGKEGDHRNVHAHILLSTRQLTREGFKGTKTRSWNEKGTLEEWREQWANHLNHALEQAGVKERVDHRSYEEQGKDKMATQHLGPEAASMEREGQRTRIGDHNRAAKEFNRVMELKKTELKEVERLISEEKKRLEQDSKRLGIEEEFRKKTEQKREELKSEDQEYNREAEQVEQEIRMVDAAIELEKERLKQEQKEADEWAKAQEESERWLAALDRDRERSTLEDCRRAKLREELNEFYGTEQVEADLASAEDRLASTEGFFSRLVGQHARCQEEVDSLRDQLQNIRDREAEANARLERELAENRKRDGFAEKVPSPTPSQESSKSMDDGLENGPDRGENSISEGFERAAGAQGSQSPPSDPDVNQSSKGPEQGSIDEDRSSLSSEFADRAGDLGSGESLEDEILRELGGDEFDLGRDGFDHGSDGPDR